MIDRNRPFLVAFNTTTAPTPDQAMRAFWPRFFCPAGAVPSLISDDRIRRLLLSGDPAIGIFEIEEEGRAVAAVIEAARAKRLH